MENWRCIVHVVLDLKSYLIERKFEDDLNQAFQTPSRVDHLEALLRFRLPSELAKRRARMVIEDIESIGFIVSIHVDQLAHGSWYIERDLPVPLLYAIADPRWALNKSDQAAFVGFGTTAGDLVYLSKCCEIGRAHFGVGWSSKVQGRLLNPQEHLDVLNELWWLDRFAMVHSVESEPKATCASKSPDWKFQCGRPGSSVGILAEVKRRPSAIRNFLGDSQRLSFFDDIVPKFEKREDSVSLTPLLRVDCVTIYCALDDQFVERANLWLSEHREYLDMLLCFSFNSGDEPALRVLPSDQSGLFQNQLLNPLFDEDVFTLGLIGHKERPGIDPNYFGH